MHPHHQQSIEKAVDHFKQDPEILALLLGGSLAHGFATEASDIDVLFLISDDDHRARTQSGRVHYYNPDLCTYPGGYVDGKYVSLGFLETVRTAGSDPARFAFKDARVLFSRLEGLEATLAEVARFPSEQQAERFRRFYAQVEAWHWYCGEALRRQNAYLLGTAVSKLILFGGRLLLAHNGLLYPYHKWFLRVLDGAPDKPAGIMGLIERLAAERQPADIERFFESVRDFRDWGLPGPQWPIQFMFDSELNWTDGQTPVDDV